MTVVSSPESPSACGGFDSQSQHSYSRALPVLRSPSWIKESYYTETGKRRATSLQLQTYLLVKANKETPIRCYAILYTNGANRSLPQFGLKVSVTSPFHQLKKPSLKVQNLLHSSDHKPIVPGGR